MPLPILSHCSEYPPRQWKRFSKPVKPSKDPIWCEMRTTYTLTMAARRLRYLEDQPVKTVTNANFKEFRDELLERLRREAQREHTFEIEAEPSRNRERKSSLSKRTTKMTRMDTIPEGKVFTKKAEIKMSPADIDHIAQFRRILVNQEVELSFNERLRQIIEQYHEIALKKAMKDRPSLEDNLSLLRLRDEVQAHVVQFENINEMKREELLEARRRPREASTDSSFRRRLRAIFDS